MQITIVSFQIFHTNESSVWTEFAFKRLLCRMDDQVLLGSTSTSPAFSADLADELLLLERGRFANGQSSSIKGREMLEEIQTACR